MQISYKKLWKLLIDHDMKKKDLQAKADISWTTITKMSKNQKVSLDMLAKICDTQNCNIGDIMDILPETEVNNQGVKE